MQELKFLDIKQAKQYNKLVKKLYRKSFLLNERVPFFLLKSRTRKGKAKFYSICENEKFVGLMYQVYYNDIVYLFFFAIVEKLRGQGYGSRVLDAIKEQYKKKRIILMAEAIDEHSDNNAERVKRIEFYNRNGFCELGYRVWELDVIYTMLGYSKEKKTVSKQEFRDLMRDFWGDFLFNCVYKKISE